METDKHFCECNRYILVDNLHFRQIVFNQIKRNTNWNKNILVHLLYSNTPMFRILKVPTVVHFYYEIVLPKICIFKKIFRFGSTVSYLRLKLSGNWTDYVNKSIDMSMKYDEANSLLWLLLFSLCTFSRRIRYSIKLSHKFCPSVQLPPALKAKREMKVISRHFQPDSIISRPSYRYL